MSATDPKASAIAEWEAGRRAADARYWAARFDEFEKRLPRLRRICGEATAARLVDDVLKAIAAAEGPFNAWQAQAAHGARRRRMSTRRRETWAKRWAEREWEQTERRIVRRLGVLERRGAEMSSWALFAHFMAAYRDRLCMVICLRVFSLHPERGEDE